MLTLSQTGSVFKPRRAQLPQELLGEVGPRGAPECGRRHGSLLSGLGRGFDSFRLGAKPHSYRVSPRSLKC